MKATSDIRIETGLSTVRFHTSLGSQRSKRASRTSNVAPRWPRRPSRELQDVPSGLQDSPGCAPDGLSGPTNIPRGGARNRKEREDDKVNDPRRKRGRDRCGSQGGGGWQNGGGAPQGDPQESSKMAQSGSKRDRKRQNARETR